MKKNNYIVKDHKKLNTLRVFSKINFINTLLYFVLLFSVVGIFSMANEQAEELFANIWCALFAIYSLYFIAMAITPKILKKKYVKAQHLDSNNELDQAYIKTVQTTGAISQRYKKRFIICTIIEVVSVIAILIAEILNPDPEYFSIYSSCAMLVLIITVFIETLMISNKYDIFVKTCAEEINTIESYLVNDIEDINPKLKEEVQKHSVREQTLLLKTITYLYTPVNRNKIGLINSVTMLISLSIGIIFTFFMISQEAKLWLLVGYLVCATLIVVFTLVQVFKVRKIQNIQFKEYNDDKIKYAYNIILLNHQMKAGKISLITSLVLDAVFIIATPLLFWFLPLENNIAFIVIFISMMLWAFATIFVSVAIRKETIKESRPYLLELEKIEEETLREQRQKQMELNTIRADEIIQNENADIDSNDEE